MSVTMLQINENKLFLLYFFQKWKQCTFYHMQDLKSPCNANIQFFLNGNVEQSAKELCRLNFFYFTKGYCNRNQQLSKQEKCLKTWVLVSKFFSWKFQREGNKKRKTRNQVIFVYFVTKNKWNATKMQIFFLFLWMKGRR
jgi:hypothetical protein